MNFIMQHQNLIVHHIINAIKDKKLNFHVQLEQFLIFINKNVQEVLVYAMNQFVQDDRMVFIKIQHMRVVEVLNVVVDN